MKEDLAGFANWIWGVENENIKNNFKFWAWATARMERPLAEILAWDREPHWANGAVNTHFNRMSAG